MKLRLPHQFQAALMAAIASVSLTTLSSGTLTVAAGAALLAGQQAQAGMTTTTTTNLDDNITYNGKIITMSGSGGNVSSRTYQQYMQNAEGTKMVDGAAGVYGWKYFANNQTEYGNTMRLLGLESGTKTYTSDFSPFSLGGLIVEDGAGTYTLGRAGTATDFNGVGDVNMNIEGSITLLSNNGISFLQGGEWKVAANRTLEFSTTQALALKAGIGVNISGGGLVKVSGKLDTGVGATINVAENTTLQVTGTSTLGGTITNAGTATFGGAVTLTNDLSGFDFEAAFEDYEESEGKGFAGSKKYTVINNTGSGSSNLASVTYNSQSYTLTNGKFTLAGDTDYTTYYIQADNAGMDLAQAISYAQTQGGGATLGTVVVQGANATITVGSSQTLNTLNIAANKSATLSGAGTLTLGTLSNGGTLNIGSKVTTGTLALTSVSSAANAPIQVQDGGVFTLSTNTTIDGAKVSNGDNEITTQAYRKMYEGLVVTSTGTGKVVWDGSINDYDNGVTGDHTYELGYSNMKVTGNVKINASARNVTWAVGSGKSLEIGGNYWMSNKQYASVDDATLTVGGNLKLAHETNNGAGNLMAKFTATNGANVTLNGIEFVGGGNIVSIDGSTLSFTKASGNVLSRTGSNVTAANTVTLNNATLVAQANSWSMAAMTGNDAATVSITGTTTVNAASGKQISLEANSINGKFVFAAGSTGTLLLESAAGVLTEGLVLNGATVGFAGTWDLTALDDGTTKPTYTGGAESGNGFAALATTVTLADLSGGGSITADSENATFKINEITGTLDHTTGIVSTSGDPDYSVFHVMSKSENVTQGRKDSHDPIYSLADGATLVVDAALDGSKLTPESGSTGNATLNIQGGQTYTSDGNAKNITITGAGTYALTKTTASGSWNTVPMIDALDATNWTGTVLIENVQKFGSINLNSYGTSHSRVKLSGVTGWMPNDTTHNPLLEIGDGGLKLIDGGSKKYTEFAGGVAGGGTLDYAVTSSADNMTFKFTGGVADWTGAFKVSVGKTANLEFSGSATNVNAAIQRTAGTLNMQVGDGSTAFSTTFSKDVTASSLTVKANAVATFNGTTVIDNGLTLESGATVTNEGALTLGGAIVFGGSAIENNGTVAFGSNVVFNMESLTPEDGVYTLFSGTGTPVDLRGFSTADIVVAGGTAGKKWTFGDDGTISYTLGAEKVWTGGESYYWNYQDANWSGETFAENDTAVFNVEWDMVQVNTAVKATTIQVTGGGMLMLSATDGASLSASSVSVEGNGTNFAVSTEITDVEEFNVGEGAVWALSNNQTLGRGANNGTISMFTGYTLTLTDGSTAAALMQSVEGGGNIKLTANTFFAGSAKSSAPTRTKATGTLIVDNATLSIGSMETGPYEETYVNMSSFQHVQLDNGTLYIHNNEFDLNGLTVNSGKTGTVRIYDSKAYDYNTLNLKGTTQVDGTLIFNGAWKHSFTIDAMAGTGEVKFQGIDKDEGAPKRQTANLMGGTIGNLTISGDNAATVIVNVNGDLTVDSSATINKGVMNVSGSLTVNSKALDLSSGGSATGTLNIKSSGTVTLKKANNSSLWLDDGAHLNLEAGGTLDLKKYDVIIAGRVNNASIVATTNNQQYGTGNTNITVTNADVTAQANITLANKLVNSTVDAGTHTVTLTNAANVLAGATVGEGGTLNINAAAELKSAITNSGTVAFNSNVTASGLELHANQAVLLDTNGAYTLDTSGNYFAGATADYIVLVEGGTVNPSGHTLTMSDTAYDIQSSGLAVANVSWGSGWIKNCQYYQNEGSAKVTEIYANALELGATCNRIRVTNASLEVDDEAYNLEVDNAHITVTGTNGTIDMLAPLGGTSTIELQTGKTLNLPEISFAENDAETKLRLKHADATDYAVTDNSNLANAMVRITSLKDDAVRNGQVTITAAAGTSGVYRVNSEGFDVDATRLEKIANSRVQVNNTLNVKEIHNDAAGKTGDFVLTKGVDAAALDTVIATSGNIEFYEMSSTGAAAQLAKLDIAANKSVSFYSSGIENAKVEASVTVVGTLTAGAGATLNANLNMATGSTLDVSADGGVNGLLMGSTVTLNEGMNLADYTDEWSAWEDGTKYALFTGVDGLNIGSGMGKDAFDYMQWVDAKEYFTNIEEANRYFLCYGGAPADNQNGVLQASFNGSNVGMVYIMVMPEPTTGTLSLLALCALAARRRRK